MSCLVFALLSACFLWGSGGNRSSRSNGCYRSSGGNGPSRPNGCYRSSGGNGSSRPNRSYRSSGGNGPSRPNGRYRSNGGNGSSRPNGRYRSNGGNGPSGPTGATGAAGEMGPPGPTEDDIFASFYILQALFTVGSLIPLFPEVSDPTGHIVPTDAEHIVLSPGYYLVTYKVSAIFETANYMQIVPSYNGIAHLETGIYFATRTDGSSACGASSMIIRVPSQTVFTLTYSGSGNAFDGQVNLTILRLRRSLSP